jgi:hypothetical protein
VVDSVNASKHESHKTTQKIKYRSTKPTDACVVAHVEQRLEVFHNANARGGIRPDRRRHRRHRFISLRCAFSQRVNHVAEASKTVCKRENGVFVAAVDFVVAENVGANNSTVGTIIGATDASCTLGVANRLCRHFSLK